MTNVFYYQMPLCRMGIVEDNEAITNIFFADETNYFPAVIHESHIIKKAARQLEEYFAGKRQIFDLPLRQHGTDFQMRVWQALRTIPYGETRSYQDIAIAIGNPNACRAVGQANNRNSIAIVVPCHRVIGANGSLVGFAGRVDLKAKLLRLENSAIQIRDQGY